jgi:hypothetical protein
MMPGTMPLHRTQSPLIEDVRSKGVSIREMNLFLLLLFFCCSLCTASPMLYLSGRGTVLPDAIDAGYRISFGNQDLAISLNVDALGNLGVCPLPPFCTPPSVIGGRVFPPYGGSFGTYANESFFNFPPFNDVITFSFGDGGGQRKAEK